MKTKMLVLACVFAFGFLFLSHDYSSAQSGTISKIGTVNIERVSMECDAMKNYIEKAKADAVKMKAEEDKLNTAIDALSTELDSNALKIGSPEFFKKNRELKKIFGIVE